MTAVLSIKGQGRRQPISVPFHGFTKKEGSIADLTQQKKNKGFTPTDSHRKIQELLRGKTPTFLDGVQLRVERRYAEELHPGRRLPEGVLVSDEPHLPGGKRGQSWQHLTWFEHRCCTLHAENKMRRVPVSRPPRYDTRSVASCFRHLQQQY